ncbi:aminoglycoside phosphotransferase family protein [Nonomuraea sp. NPDC046802]|uniref:aminoglycoside phosphotransferase family protein n=1 Tax=Nonomuraea sp. NPDC046802 TaxID=3154919 RepID=UPI0034063940
MRLGELLGSGRSADVYAIDDDRVLRRYRLPVDAGREAAVMEYVGAHGYPVPDVYPGAERPTDLVMRRLTGPTMLRALMEGEIVPEEVGEILARLLLRLHEIPARASGDPHDRVLHLDLHPDNVLLTPDGPMVIDWCDSREGPPGQDCAMSALIVAQVAVDEESDLAAPARLVLGALLAGLGAAMDCGDGLEQARRRRGANQTLTARELGLLDSAVTLVRT